MSVTDMAAPVFRTDPTCNPHFHPGVHRHLRVAGRPVGDQHRERRPYGLNFHVLQSAGVAGVFSGTIALVAWIQNQLEEKTNMPAILKAPSSEGNNPVPDSAGEPLSDLKQDVPDPPSATVNIYRLPRLGCRIPPGTKCQKGSEHCAPSLSTYRTNVSPPYSNRALFTHVSIMPPGR